MDKQTEYEIEVERRAMQKESVRTELEKEKFVSEILGGLGKEIKEKGGEVKRIKIPWYKKFFKVIGL